VVHVYIALTAPLFFTSKNIVDGAEIALFRQYIHESKHFADQKNSENLMHVGHPTLSKCFMDIFTLHNFF
jgi:hypothetical protein